MFGSDGHLSVSYCCNLTPLSTLIQNNKMTNWGKQIGEEILILSEWQQEILEMSR